MNNAMNTTDEAALREKFERWHLEKYKYLPVRSVHGSREYVVDLIECRWQAYLAASRPREWQPIDSAPKDGTEILIREKFGRIIHVKWGGDLHGTWVAARGIGFYDYATHWQPLPSSPTPESNEG